MFVLLFDVCVMVICGMSIVLLFLFFFRWVCMNMLGSNLCLGFGNVLCSVIDLVVVFIVMLENCSVLGWVYLVLFFIMSVMVVLLLFVFFRCLEVKVL